MPRPRRPGRRPTSLVDTKSAISADFGDRESQRVLAAAARAVARELGREVAREYFAALISRTKAS